MARPSLLTKRLIAAINRACFGRSYLKSNCRVKRMALLLEEAYDEHPTATYWLATMYWEGWGLVENPERAMQLFHLAAAYGNRPALYNLGVAYDNGLGVEKNQVTAFGFFVATAKRGDTEAYFPIGSMYCFGHGVVQDYTKARHWYRKSAKAGFSDGMLGLARCYQRGVGGARNQRLAIYWFAKAIEAGNVRAQVGLGIEYTINPAQDFQQARYWLEQAAEQEDSQAMYVLGKLEEAGWNGKKNPADALFWFNQAASLGHMGAALLAAELQGEKC